MKRIIYILFLGINSLSLKSQSCLINDVVETPVLKSGSVCTNIESYDIIESINLISIKRIRFDIHVFQDITLEVSNFQNIERDRNFLEAIVNQINYNLSHLEIVSPGTSPHVVDSKIRLVLSEIYFHQVSGNLCYESLSDGTYDLGDRQYAYIQGLTTLSSLEKDSTLHLIYPPFNSRDKIGINSAGFAYIGQNGYVWLRGHSYSFYCQVWNESMDPLTTTLVPELAAHSTHELGHKFGLFHNFQNGVDGLQCDDCSDNDNTSNLTDCPNQASSNNFMDYSPMLSRTAISEQQIGKAHQYLSGYGTFGGGTVSKTLLLDHCEYNASGETVIRGGTSLKWNFPFLLHEDLILEENAELTVNCELSLPFEANVIVNGGAILRIDEGEIINKCGRPNEVITTILVENEGVLQLSNTFLSDYNVIVQSGGTVILENDVVIHNSCKIDVETDAYICFSNNLNLTLENKLSVINLHPGFNYGTNPSVLQHSGCLSNLSTLNISGNGTINMDFSMNVFIQNETISNNRYITGLNIFAGSNVTDSKPQGEVVIGNSSEVILNAEEDVILEGDFEVELGSSLKAQ